MENNYNILSVQDKTVAHIYRQLDRLAPFSTAEDFDNVGLLIGDSNAPVDKILICLDVTEELTDIAIKNNVRCIICHHPLIFHPIKKLNDSFIDYPVIKKLINNNIALIATHTNFDKCPISNSIKSLELIASGLVEIAEFDEYGATMEFDNKMEIGEFSSQIKKHFGGERARFYIKNKKIVSKVCFFAGSFSHNEEIILHCSTKYDILVSSEFKQSNINYAEKLGLGIIDIEHNQSEKVFVDSVFTYLKDCLPL